MLQIQRRRAKLASCSVMLQAVCPCLPRLWRAVTRILAPAMDEQPTDPPNPATEQPDPGPSTQNSQTDAGATGLNAQTDAAATGQQDSQPESGLKGQQTTNLRPNHGTDAMATESERYEATMVLGAVGDAMGYHNGHWEFCYDGSLIHEQVARLGGVAQLKIKKPGFIVSDDTILHIATAEGLCSDWNGDLTKLYHTVAKRYQARSRDMGGRAPGATTMSAIHILRPDRTDGFRIPFNRRGGGCGAAMRSVPIGLAFPRPEQLDCLIAVAIETGRMTHNHPTGYLGSLAVALFVSYALQGKPPRAWGAGLMETLEGAWQYVERTGIDVEENKSTWGYFKTRWNEYLDERGIADGQSEPTFPERYGVKERDQFYRSVSFAGWGGASGHDAPMIAYDAILGAGQSWEEVCKRAVLHGGDSDSTGIIACALWGAMHGFRRVPENNYKKVEFGDPLRKLAGKLRKVAQADSTRPKREGKEGIKTEVSQQEPSAREGDGEQGTEVRQHGPEEPSAGEGDGEQGTEVRQHGPEEPSAGEGDGEQGTEGMTQTGDGGQLGEGKQTVPIEGTDVDPNPNS